jgi:hypothetical protein
VGRRLWSSLESKSDMILLSFFLPVSTGLLDAILAWKTKLTLQVRGNAVPQLKPIDSYFASSLHKKLAAQRPAL